MEIIKGSAVLLGDHVDTDQILPGYAMAEPIEKLGEFAMAGHPDPGLRQKLAGGPILVAGANFGCGSSREQAPMALKLAGVRLVIASGFARIFRRNAINIGLPVYVADLAHLLKEGDVIAADLLAGSIRYPGGLYTAPPISESVAETLRFGGLIPRVRAELGR